MVTPLDYEPSGPMPAERRRLVRATLVGVALLAVVYILGRIETFLIYGGG